MNKKVKYTIAIVICLALISASLVGAYKSYYPPSSDWQQGYWDTTAGSSGSIYDSYIIFHIKGGGGDGDEIYYVTSNPIDIRNITEINITWSATFDIETGACVLGIGQVQADRMFTTNVSLTDSFDTNTTSLDVSGAVPGDYYLKVGGYVPAGGTNNIDLLVFDVSQRPRHPTQRYPTNGSIVSWTMPGNRTYPYINWTMDTIASGKSQVVEYRYGFTNDLNCWNPPTVWHKGGVMLKWPMDNTTPCGVYPEMNLSYDVTQRYTYSVYWQVRRYTFDPVNQTEFGIYSEWSPIWNYSIKP